MRGHNYQLHASNYKITSTPIQEWMYIAGDDARQRLTCPDMGHRRRIVPIEEMLQKPLAKIAKLTRAEMIAVVMYTGSHVCGVQRHPAPVSQVALQCIS